MLWTGIFLGVLTALGFWMIFVKLPRQLKFFIARHPLIPDLGATVGAYLLLGSLSNSIISAIGCATTGILFSGYLLLHPKTDDGEESEDD